MSRNNFNDRILRGFILSSDALFEIRQLLDRRQKTKFSDGLSPEARMALKQMREDTLAKFEKHSDDSAGDDEEPFIGRKNVQKAKKFSRKSGRDKSKRQISFIDSPREISNKSLKSVDKTRTFINTKETTGSDDSRMKDVEGDIIISTTEPNPVDKCREWVVENSVQTPFIHNT